MDMSASKTLVRCVFISGYIALGAALLLVISALGFVLYRDVKDEWDYKNGK